MTLSTYIVDDEQHAIDVLRAYTDQTPGLILLGASTNPLIALETITDLSPDIVFLDIDMPELSGMSMSRMLNNTSLIVFTTSHREFAIEAFENNAFDYLLKPFSQERFLKCIQKARMELPAKTKNLVKEPPAFFVKTEIRGKLVRITIGDILYIESQSNYLLIHLAGEKVRTYLSIGEITHSFNISERRYATRYLPCVSEVGKISLLQLVPRFEGWHEYIKTSQRHSTRLEKET